MRTKIFLAFILLSLLFSCGKKSQTEVKEDALVLTGAQTTKNTNPSNLADSLKQVIKNIRSTDYDLVVRALKSFPEYKNALFLAPKENREYLSLVQENADRFKSNTQYWTDVEKSWRSYDDTTFIKMETSLSCKIIFDTTQTVKPLLSFTDQNTEKFKDKRTRKEYSDFHKNVYDYYYIPKFQIGYVIINSKDFYGNGQSYFSYLTSYEWLDMQIRNGFRIRQTVIQK